MSELIRFEGNCPKNVAKEAKYVIRGDPAARRRSSIVALTYRTSDDERWHMATDKHPALVEMVNGVKTALGLSPNGSFYINEYHQVLVPSAANADYYLAGTYESPLVFDFDNNTISGRPVNAAGRALSPGEDWTGPHPGIPYKLTAGAKDIKFSIFPRPNVEKEVKLSKQIGPERASRVAARVQQVKGFLGGRFYVNEFKAMFAPLQAGYDLRYVYIGQLDMNEWFTPPQR